MVAYLCVLALLFSFVVFLFFRQMYICHNIHLCLLMAKSMFSADFANKLFDVASEVLIGSFYLYQLLHGRFLFINKVQKGS